MSCYHPTRIIGCSSDMSEANESKPPRNLHCALCGRSAGTGPNGVDTVVYLEQEWCARCARIGQTFSGLVYVSQPSPGRMFENPIVDPLDAWIDCYGMKPKRRIKVDEARPEIQRAWAMWDGDKDASGSMLMFFGWLQRFRPYFLTFRSRGDPWQKVHVWLLQYERAKQAAR